jgi:hypothetical protein
VSLDRHAHDHVDRTVRDLPVPDLDVDGVHEQMLKRQMFGRAAMDLLRKRVLLAR